MQAMDRKTTMPCDYDSLSLSRSPRFYPVAEKATFFIVMCHNFLFAIILQDNNNYTMTFPFFIYILSSRDTRTL